MTDEETQQEKTVELVPTSAADWPTAKTTAPLIIELPSGNVAHLRRPPLQYLIATGQVPPKLWSRVQAEGEALFEDPLKTLDPSELKLFIDWMISCAFVEPIVSMARKQGTLYIGDLSEDDKGEVVGLLGISAQG